MKRIIRLLSLMTAALSLSVMTITVLDGFNPLMRFLTSTPSKILIFAFGICALLSAFLQLWGRR